MNKMIQRSIDMLEYASNHLEGFRMSDAMADLGIPKTTTFDIIHTLVECEMLEVLDPNLKTFTLGHRSYDIGYRYLKSGSILDIAEDELKKLGDKLNKTVFLGKYDHDEVLYIYKYQPPTALLNHCSVNTRAGLYYTALGKAMLAYRNDDFDFYSIKFVKFTENTIMDVPSLLNELYLTRKRGYAIDNREIKDYMVCVSAPIFDKNNEVNYAISVSSIFDSNFDVEEESKLVKEAAQRITKKLKYIF